MPGTFEVWVEVGQVLDEPRLALVEDLLAVELTELGRQAAHCTRRVKMQTAHSLWLCHERLCTDSGYVLGQ